MTKGILYGVGVGPGDKRLLTLLAVETLKSCSKIVVPNSGGEPTALKTVQEYIIGKEQIHCSLPMTRDEAVLAKAHQESANIICSQLDKGENLAFITLGDPTVYSTYMYIHRIVMQRGYRVNIVNGITSFCAAAAKLNISLCDKDEALHIIPASCQNSEEWLSLGGTKVLMKSGKQIGAVIENLREADMLNNASMVECCYMENEKIYTDITKVRESSYFSLIIVKE